MSRAKYCVECGAAVVVYAKQTAMCEECVDEIWTKLKEFSPLVPDCGDKEDEVNSTTDIDQSFSTEHLERLPEVDRTCLKCAHKFKALGKFVRICDACKERSKHKDEPLTIY